MVVRFKHGVNYKTRITTIYGSSKIYGYMTSNGRISSERYRLITNYRKRDQLYETND